MNKLFRAISNTRMKPLGSPSIEGIPGEHPVQSEYDFYKSKLSNVEKQNYERIKEAASNCESKIFLTPMTQTQYDNVFNAILLDCPMFFHFDNCSIVSKGNKVWLEPKYLLPRNAYNKQRHECEKQLIALCDRLSVGDYERILSLHKAILSSVKYQDRGMESHTIIGPLLNSEGVCDGISKTVKAACDMMGIPCVVIRGEAKQDVSIINSHAWNAIMINREWGFFDFTFDITTYQNNPCRDLLNMDYFLKSWDDMSTDHFKWNVIPPVSNSSRDYYDINGFVVSSPVELENLIIKRKNGTKSECSYKVSKGWGDYDNDQVMKTLVNNLVKRLNRNCNCEYYFNDSQRIGHVKVIF